MKRYHTNQYSQPPRRMPPITTVSAAEGIHALILRYADQHHPLAAGFDKAEVPLLTVGLFGRMAQAGQGLRTSWADVRHLLNALENYVFWATGRGQPPITYAPLVDHLPPGTSPAPLPGPKRIGFTDEDHLTIVREIAAWHGNALMLLHPNSAWRNPGSLLDVAVEATGNIPVDDGRTVHRMLMTVGYMSAVIWDHAVYGNAHHYDPIIWDTFDE